MKLPGGDGGVVWGEGGATDTGGMLTSNSAWVPWKYWKDHDQLVTMRSVRSTTWKMRLIEAVVTPANAGIWAATTASAKSWVLR
jgi:hypothetical protein